MNQKPNIKHQLTALSLVICMAFWTLAVPAKVSAKTLPANSVFNQPLDANEPKVNTEFGSTSVYFEENNGQFDKRVKYFARGTSGYSLFLTSTEAVYALRSPESKVQSPKSEEEKLNKRTLDSGLRTQDSAKAVAVFMKLAGANENSDSVGLEEMPHRTNYFKGDESNWRTEIPNFKQVQMNNVYQGIDLVWKGKANGSVQYDFVVEPNADPTKIEWEIEGAESVEIDDQGDLLIKTEFGTIKQQKPFSYQENATGFKQEVESRFVIKETKPSQIANRQSQIKFEIGNYDRSKTLTIDPSVNLSNLSFSTFLGGTEIDEGRAVAVDRAGNVYVTGETRSTSFPTTPGSFDTSHNGGSDVFVTKLNPAGSALVYSTFIGGGSTDIGYDIAIDASGNAFITGQTSDTTTDYPTTTGAFNETHNGSSDVFVTKLNPAGSALVYSTFIGGSSSDRGYGITTDASGNAFITGSTSDTTTDYPTTTGAFDQTHNGGSDVFVTKLDSAGSTLVYSTFIGGSDSDIGYGIAIDASGNAFITGIADDGTTDYPTTTGAFNETHNGGFDVFVTKLNASGSALVYSTFIGGIGNERGNSIAIDASGNVFITGYTNDTSTIDYPTTTGAFDQTHNGIIDAFVTKLNASGSALVYSTFLGGSSFDEGYGIKIDASGSAFITGYANDGTTDLPTTTGAFNETHNGSSDVFVTKLNPAGSTLVYSTFIGGSGSDEGNGIAIDASGNAFITGLTNDGTTDYPTTAEVFQPDHNGNDDVFVSKFGDFSISGRTLDTSGNALPNTAVALSGDGTGFMLSDVDGYFYFGDTLPVSLVGGDYLVSATQILYNFNPPNYQVNVDRNKQITFVGRPTSSGPTAAFAALGGKVQSTVGNVGLPNTRLTLINTVSGDVSFVITDANGDYEFEPVLTGSFYLVAAEREGYNFAPQIYQVNHLEQNLNLDFLAFSNSPRPVDDFDGDGKTDLAVFRPNEGNWYILNSQDNSVKTFHFGLSGDIPVASDYDGDDRADIAVHRPSVGNWYRLDSSDDEFHTVHFGQSGDLPVQADFDGDGKADLAVYRPSTGVWHRLMSQDGSYQATKFGIEEDQPIAADYDSDGKADLTVYRDGIWYRLRSSDDQVEAFQFGLENDKPLAVDFDGDSRMDTAIYRPSNGVWYWLESSDGDFQARQFGISTDIPAPADYNGDGRFEQSVFRNGIWYVLRNDSSFYSAQFGQTGDVPIPAN